MVSSIHEILARSARLESSNVPSRVPPLPLLGNRSPREINFRLCSARGKRNFTTRSQLTSFDELRHVATRLLYRTVVASPTMFYSHLFKVILAVSGLAVLISAADLPSKKYLNLAAVKKMVAAAEAEAQNRHVEVTLCIVDESGNLLFLEKADSAPLNTITWAQRKARHAAFYKSPSKSGEDAVKNGNTAALAYPDFFPNQGGLPIIVDGQILGGIAASGARSEVDEAVAQAGLDALLRK